MVRSFLMALLVGLSAAGAATAQPDWSQAGGALFVGEAASDSPGREPSGGAGRWPVPAQPFAAAVEEASARSGLDPKLLHALVAVESAYRPDALSRAGAAGLTQLMPATAEALGVIDQSDPAANLAGGAAYLARQLARFGDLRLALAAYNAGPERVARLGRVPDIAETRAYVVLVVDCYLALTAGRSIRTARDCRAAPVGP